MLRKAFGVLCLGIGIVGFSSVGFSKEFLVGLGEEVVNLISPWSAIDGDRVTIVACHPEEQSFSLVITRTWTHGGIAALIRIKPGDYFVAFDKKKSPQTIKFVSFAKDCIGRFQD